MSKVQSFHVRAGNMLADIADMLAPGAKLTLVVRFEGKPGQDIVLTDDMLDGPMEVLARRKAALAADPASGQLTQQVLR